MYNSIFALPIQSVGAVKNMHCGFPQCISLFFLNYSQLAYHNSCVLLEYLDFNAPVDEHIFRQLIYCADKAVGEHLAVEFFVLFAELTAFVYNRSVGFYRQVVDTLIFFLMIGDFQLVVGVISESAQLAPGTTDCRRL